MWGADVPMHKLAERCRRCKAVKDGFIYGGQVMRNALIALLVVAIVAAATFGLTELAQAGYPFTGFLGD